VGEVARPEKASTLFREPNGINNCKARKPSYRYRSELDALFGHNALILSSVIRIQGPIEKVAAAGRSIELLPATRDLPVAENHYAPSRAQHEDATRAFPHKEHPGRLGAQLPDPDVTGEFCTSWNERKSGTRGAGREVMS